MKAIWEMVGMIAGLIVLFWLLPVLIEVVRYAS